MWTFTRTMNLFLLLVVCLAYTTGEEDIEIEIVELEIFDDESTTDITDEPTEDPDVTTELPEEPTDGDTTSTPPISTTTEEPVWQDYQTRINILDKTEEEFNRENEEKFKTSVARYAERYCNETEGAPCGSDLPVPTQDPAVTPTDEPGVTPENDESDPVFHINAAQTQNNIQPEDVIIEQRRQVGDDLQIGYFVQLGDNFMLSKNTLDTVMEVYGGEISEESGITFELIQDPSSTTEPSTTSTTVAATPEPSGGLEPWEIALIVLGSVGGAAIIAGVVYYFVFRKKPDTRFRELDYESTSRLHDPVRPAHTYESLAKNRQSIPDSNTGTSTTFNNATYENSAFETNETDNRR